VCTTIPLQNVQIHAKAFENNWFMVYLVAVVAVNNQTTNIGMLEG
jgi:hypothetical protein